MVYYQTLIPITSGLDEGENSIISAAKSNPYTSPFTSLTVSSSI